MKISSHKDLKAWQESMDLVERIYKLTHSFPVEERYGLTSQLRRSSVSVPSNIAEGAGRKSNKEWRRFLYISLGSLSEVETQLEIAIRLGLLTEVGEVFEQTKYIRNMIVKLIRSLERKM